jgi:hypothetical protein
MKKLTAKRETHRTAAWSSGATRSLQKGANNMNADNKDFTPMAHQPSYPWDEKVASLFQPDTLLAAEYFSTMRRKTALEPEKKLMLAVLEDAVKCYQDNAGSAHPKGKKLFDDTEQWVFETASDWLFSFENVCALLGLNPDYLRAGLMRWKVAKPSRRETEETYEAKKLAS